MLRRREDFVNAQAAEAAQAPGKRRKSRAARQEAPAEEKEASSVKTAIDPQTRRNPKKANHVPLSAVKASDTCPAVFRVRARIVDFFPDDLRDCTVLRCTNCDKMCVPFIVFCRPAGG